MTDKYNETNDDFFDKFDEIADKEAKKISETDTYSADAADAEYSYGSASRFRSDRASDGDQKPSGRRRASDKKAKEKKSKEPKKSSIKNPADSRHSRK